MKAPEPGIYESVDFETYFSWDCICQSTLRMMLRSPVHYLAARQFPSAANSEPFRFGTFAHAGRLEPLAALERYVVMPDFTAGLTRPNGEPYANPRATNAYKQKVAEFQRVNSGKEIVSEEWFSTLKGMASALDQHERTREYLSGDGPAEVSLVWDDPLTGMRCKGRLDKWDRAQNRIVEFCTAADASDFGGRILKYGYDFQAAFYRDGLKLLSGRDVEVAFVVAEKSRPYGVRAARMSEATLSVGYRKYRSCLNRAAECHRTNSWPSYDDPESWEMPRDERTKWAAGCEVRA